MNLSFTFRKGCSRGALVGVAGLVVLASGCSRTEPEGAAAAGAVERGGQRKLVLYGMPDYFNMELLDAFHRQTGVHVDYQGYEEADEVEARLRSNPGSVDVVIIDSFNLNKLRKLSLLHPLDKSAMPNLAHASPKFMNLDADPGNAYSVPYHWGTTLLAYRKDMIPRPEPSWRLLWDPSLKGQVMMMQDSFEPLAVAMLLQGKSPSTLETADYEAASALLLEHIHSMEARYGSDEEVREALADGTVAAAMCYSGDAAVVAADNPAVDFFIPKEGASLWVDCLAIARDTKEEEAAHAFLNFFMDPKVAAENANAIQFASTNASADAFVDASLRDDPRLYPPPGVMERLHRVPELDAERDSLVNKFWYTVRSEGELQNKPSKILAQDPEPPQ
ncbi:MAG: PotD/PotF family extracellular solute-binding protein [Verrucomicrobiales bacterium]